VVVRVGEGLRVGAELPDDAHGSRARVVRVGGELHGGAHDRGARGNSDTGEAESDDVGPQVQVVAAESDVGSVLLGVVATYGDPDRLRDGRGVAVTPAGVRVVLDRRRKRLGLKAAPVAALDEERQPDGAEYQPEKIASCHPASLEFVPSARVA